jgi:hypothetical protein
MTQRKRAITAPNNLKRANSDACEDDREIVLWNDVLVEESEEEGGQQGRGLPPSVSDIPVTPASSPRSSGKDSAGHPFSPSFLSIAFCLGVGRFHISADIIKLLYSEYIYGYIHIRVSVRTPSYIYKSLQGRNI